MRVRRRVPFDAVGRTLRDGAKRAVRQLGYDVVRFPSRNSLLGHLLEILPECQINAVLDVGANDGSWAKGLRSIGYDGRIVSFEPLSGPFARLRRRSAGDPEWLPKNVGLGEREETVEVTLRKQSQFASLRRPSVTGESIFGEKLKATGEEEIRLARLDSVFAECVEGIRDPRVLLKLDTQGWDLEVLKGAAGCIGAIAAMQVELSVRPIYRGAPSYVEALQFIDGLGFDLSGLFPVTAGEDLRAIELDAFFVRARD